MPSVGLGLGNRLRVQLRAPQQRGDEIVLVAHDARRLEVWRRTRAGWRVTRVESGVAELTSVGCELSVAETYRDPLA